MLARLGLEDAAVAKPESRRRLLGEFGGAVGRVVVGEHDLDRPARRRGPRCAPGSRRSPPPRSRRRSRSSPAAMRLPARGRVGRLRVGLVVARDEQREDHKADDHARDVGEARSGSPTPSPDRSHRELCAPWRRGPDGERHLGQRQRQRDGEEHGRPQPRPRRPAPRQPTQAPPLLIDRLRLAAASRELVINRSRPRHPASLPLAHARPGTNRTKQPSSCPQQQSKPRPPAQADGRSSCTRAAAHSSFAIARMCSPRPVRAVVIWSRAASGASSDEASAFRLTCRSAVTSSRTSTNADILSAHREPGPPVARLSPQ